MASLLVKVRKKMSITAHRRVYGALVGEYSSVFKGRSLDFDDLRAYVPGDDVKDIDWKATARSGQVLIRRYVAIRKYNIMLVVDTGRAMAATAPSGESKRDIAVMAAGVMAYVAQRHGDLVGLTAGDSQQVTHMPLKDSLPHLERILQYIDTHTKLEAPGSDLNGLLEYIRRTMRRRMLLVIISDNTVLSSEQLTLLRRLSAQHELLFIAVDDLDPNASDWQARRLYDVDQPLSPLPSFMRRQPEVAQAYHALLEGQWKNAEQELKRLRISSVRIGSEAEVVPQIIRLLEKQKHAHR